MALHEDRMRALANREETAYRTHHAAISAAQKALERKLRRIEALRKELARRTDEAEVLVRNSPGPRVEIFHSATEYCGRVNAAAVKRDKYDRLFISEALERDLRPCSACATHLVRRRRPTSGAA